MHIDQMVGTIPILCCHLDWYSPKKKDSQEDTTYSEGETEHYTIVVSFYAGKGTNSWHNCEVRPLKGSHCQVPRNVLLQDITSNACG